jgi:hypothetical protein
MHTPSDKSQQPDNQSIANALSEKKSSGGTASRFADNRPEAVAQRKLQEMADNSEQVRQLKTIQEMANNSQKEKMVVVRETAANNLSPIQTKRISIKQLEDGGFTGPHQGGTWQFNFPGSRGIHVTVIRQNGHATHFHVRKDTTGAVKNRIDYNEDNGGNWIEGNVNVPNNPGLATQMRQRAQETITWIKSLVPPSN